MSQSNSDKRRVGIALTLPEAKALLGGNKRAMTRVLALAEQGLADTAPRCPDCLAPPGTRHYCRRWNVVGRFNRNGDFA